MNEETKYDYSKGRNVVVFLLDSFQTDAFQEIINEDEKYKEMFNGFTYFRNSLGGYPFTDISIPLILTGQYYDNQIEYNEWLKDVYTNSSITNTLQKEGFNVEIYLDASKCVYLDESTAANFEKSHFNYKQLAKLYDVAFFRYAPTLLKEVIYNDQEWLLQKIIKDDESKDYIVKSGILDAESVKKSKDLQFIDSFIYNANSNSTKDTFKFYKLLIPHWPLNLNEDLQYGKMAVNRNNYKQACKADLKIIDLAIKKLQEEEIFDNTMVLVLGDHGAGFQGQKFVLQEGMPTINETDIISDNLRAAALPLILVKPFNTSEELKTSDAPVSLVDVPRTILDQLGIDSDFPGKSMFKIDESEQRERRFMQYSSVESPYYGDMYEYIVSGYSWLNESWNPTYRKYTSKGIIENKPQEVDFGQELSFRKDGNALPYLKNGWSSAENNFTWTSANKVSLYIPLATSDDIIMKINAAPYLASGKIKEQNVNISVNGEKLTSLSYSQNDTGEKYVFIPEYLIKDSAVTIEFEFPNAASPLEMKESKDVRRIALRFYSITFSKSIKYAFGNKITFGTGGNFTMYQPTGWYSPGEEHNWSMEKASVILPVDKTNSDLLLTLDFVSYLHKGKKVDVFVNGYKAGEWDFADQNMEQVSVLIKSDLLKENSQKIEFRITGAKSPKELGVNDDVRVLGIGVKSLVLQEVSK